VSSRTIDHLLARGLLHREHAGVYAVLQTAPVALSRESAALLASGERAVLSHTSAAALWGLIPERDGPVEVTVACRGTGRSRPGINLHRSASLLRRDVRIHRGLPVTSPAWTLLDLAACLDSRSYERAFDEALVVRRLVRRNQLADVQRRANGRRGAALMRALLERRRGSRITHSEAERLCLEIIRKAELPEPRTQVRIGQYTVDLLWPDHGVAFEIDGYQFHVSRFAFDRDREKDTALKAAGVDPNRLSRDQIVFKPYFAIAAIAAALARASALAFVR
jgi:very-short-patch-repair endonuclease